MYATKQPLDTRGKIVRGHFSTVYACTDQGYEYAIKIQKSAKSYRIAAREEVLIHEYSNKSDKHGKEKVSSPRLRALCRSCDSEIL